MYSSIHHRPPTAVLTLSLHDSLPIFRQHRVPATRHAQRGRRREPRGLPCRWGRVADRAVHAAGRAERSEEHTSELQSHHEFVCRLLLEKKNQTKKHMQQNYSYLLLL